MGVGVENRPEGCLMFVILCILVICVVCIVQVNIVIYGFAFNDLIMFWCHVQANEIYSVLCGL